MNLDPKRLERQRTGFGKWRDGKAVNNILRMAWGIITAVTGFGKTYILIMAIKYMNQAHPDRDTIVVVPTTKLLQDWIGYVNSDKVKVPGHIEIHNLTNVRVFVVNTFVKYKDWKCDLLGLDECHHYANEDSQFFSTILEITKCRFLLAMSATLSRKQEEFFLKYNIPVVDNIDEVEAQRNGYIAPSIIYNLGIPLSDADKEFNDEINEKFKFYFSRFNHEFDLVKACNGRKGIPISVRLKDGKNLGKRTPEEWIKELARVNHYDGSPTHPYSPELIARNAAQCMNIIGKRRDKWQNFPSKLDVAVKILNRFPLKTICFSETSAFADKLTAKLGDIAVSYHTNLLTVGIKDGKVVEIGNKHEKEDLKAMGYVILGTAKRKKAALDAFIDPLNKVRVLSTVKALDEGVDIPSIECALQLAYTSTARQNVQRNGRAGRIDYENLDKKALIINLYMMGTQEEKWLKEKQKGSKSAIWVESIEQINPTRTLNLTSDGRKQGEITIRPTDIGVSRSDSKEEVTIS